ncbi:M15 family metallopeptidase [Candidatus Odyssella thessalonicensis]|uniref:M15 family metallopeptidase n=1 Tax=Candidatus Odyssella thessalonicensis TaxID=84647 RepID=UPI000225A960|nr:M15 family metallopeptidase [Candidatus Odyssella thessalonicensis]
MYHKVVHTLRYLLGSIVVLEGAKAQQYDFSAEIGLHPGFVFLTDIDPTIIESPRCYEGQNFLGKPVEGYTTPRIICTKAAAEKLKAAHAALNTHGYKLVVYDGYRPQRAVNEFIKWSQDEADQSVKELYYPTVAKKDLFELGYVAKKSGHSREALLT